MSGHSSPEPKVSPVELFFDLVFVYAITQVTTLLLSDLSPLGFVRSGLALFMIWWAWSLYTWMANAIGPSGRATRAGITRGKNRSAVNAIAQVEAQNTSIGSAVSVG